LERDRREHQRQGGAEANAFHRFLVRGFTCGET
jgi:hypothetical protein